MWLKTFGPSKLSGEWNVLLQFSSTSSLELAFVDFEDTIVDHVRNMACNRSHGLELLLPWSLHAIRPPISQHYVLYNMFWKKTSFATCLVEFPFPLVTLWTSKTCWFGYSFIFGFFHIFIVSFVSCVQSLLVLAPWVWFSHRRPSHILIQCPHNWPCVVNDWFLPQTCLWHICTGNGRNLGRSFYVLWWSWISTLVSSFLSTPFQTLDNCQNHYV